MRCASAFFCSLKQGLISSHRHWCLILLVFFRLESCYAFRQLQCCYGLVLLQIKRHDLLERLVFNERKRLPRVRILSLNQCARETIPAILIQPRILFDYGAKTAQARVLRTVEEFHGTCGKRFERDVHLAVVWTNGTHMVAQPGTKRRILRDKLGSEPHGLPSRVSRQRAISDDVREILNRIILLSVRTE